MNKLEKINNVECKIDSYFDEIQDVLFKASIDKDTEDTLKKIMIQNKKSLYEIIEYLKDDS